MVAVLFSILSQMEFHLVQNRKENCHHDHIPFNVKGIGCIVFSVLRGFKGGGERRPRLSNNRCRNSSGGFSPINMKTNFRCAKSSYNYGVLPISWNEASLGFNDWGSYYKSDSTELKFNILASFGIAEMGSFARNQFVFV